MNLDFWEKTMMKEEEYVYIQTLHNLCRINLSNFWSYSSSSDDSKSPSPIVEVVVDYRKNDDYPILMTPVVLDRSQLFLVGGVKQIKDDSLKNEYGFSVFYRGLSIKHVDPNEEIFHIPPPPSSSSSTIFKDIPKMLAQKPLPISFTVDSKTYVLDSLEHGMMDEVAYNKTVSFEVLDHKDLSWTPLPNLPFNEFTIWNHFFLRHKLFLNTTDGIAVYNFKTKLWNLDYTGPFYRYFNVSTANVVEYDGFVIAYTYKHKLVALRLGENGDDDDDDDDDKIVSVHKFVEINKLGNELWDCSMGFVFHLGDGRMCLLMYGYEPPLIHDPVPFPQPMSVRLTTFQFDSSEPSSPSVSNIKDHIFRRQQLPFDPFFIHNAFLV